MQILPMRDLKWVEKCRLCVLRKANIEFDFSTSQENTDDVSFVIETKMRVSARSLYINLLNVILLQTTDDILVASAECPSDDEDIDPCEPSSGGLG